jgi:hypothetical protein
MSPLATTLTKTTSATKLTTIVFVRNQSFERLASSFSLLVAQSGHADSSG